MLFIARFFQILPFGTKHKMNRIETAGNFKDFEISFKHF
jgi:hypothetical protein